MWYVFFVAAPQLHANYEFRVRFDTDTSTWTSIIVPCQGAPVCFEGDDETTAKHLFDRIFNAIGLPELAPSLN